MIIGSITEDINSEKRISITPDIIKKYLSNNFEILIENNYGKHLGFSDEDFKREGCKIETKENIIKNSDIVLQLNLPDKSLIQHFK